MMIQLWNCILFYGVSKNLTSGAKARSFFGFRCHGWSRDLPCLAYPRHILKTGFRLLRL